MKNLKKVCALVLSLAMIVSTFTVSFAAEDTKTDAEVCEALGLIQGDGDGVTEEYLGTESPRWKIAIMSLRLRGKYEEALAFEGTETFADAEDMTWVAGRAILAYLKANSDCGWQGDDKNQFDPNGMMTVQQYYKVMLEALGYKQGTDFEWAEVMEFAASKDLVVAADAEKLTMNDVAAVTVETLKAKTSEGKTLTDVLVEAEVIDADSATDLLDYVAPVTAKMEAARAIDATTIVATFDEAVEVDADDFAVAAGDEEFAVTNVTSANAGKVAVLTVAELKIGEKYAVSYGEVSKNVVPTTKNDETKPAIASAEAITGEIVQVVINSTNVNQDTLVADNFSLNNDASVLSAEINFEAMKQTANTGKTIVVLGVTGLKNGKAYTIKSNGVESFEGLTSDDSKATFAGKDKDTTAPKVKSAKSIGGYQVEVIFDESVKLDEATATEIGNYSISPELEITDARIKRNVIGNKNNDENVVILTTADQKESTAYTLTVNNVSDGTNVMKEAGKTVFAGLKKVTNQSVKAAKALDADKVKVTFDYECNETALDVANYEIDKDIEVISAEFEENLNATDNVNKDVVILTTSEMKASTAYTVTVKTGAQDILGQGLKEAKKLVFAGVAKDTSFTSNISAKAKNKTTVEIVFDEEIDRATAIEVANYKVSELGYPSSATLSSNGLVVTLTVQEQKASQPYTITMNNLKDKAGNVIKADTTVKFTGIGDVVRAVAVKEVKALSEKMILVTFNQDIKGTSGNIKFTLKENDGDRLDNINSNNEVTATVPTSATDTVVISLDTNVKITASEVYKLTLTSLGNAIGADTNHTISNEPSDKEKTFVGSSSEKPVFNLTGAIAIDQTHIKLLFDSNVGAVVGTDVRLFSEATLENTAKDKDDATITVKTLITNTSDPNVNAEIVNKKEVIVTLDNKLDNNKIYYVGVGGDDTKLGYVKSVPSNITLAPATDESYARAVLSTGVLTSATEKELAIKSVVMFNKNDMEVEFDTDIAVTVGSSTDNANLDPSDIKIYKGDTEITNAVKKVAVKPGTQNKLLVYVEKADEMADDSGMAKLVINSDKTLHESLKTKLGEVDTFKSDANKASFAVSTTKKDLPEIASALAINDNKVKVTFTEDVFLGQSVALDAKHGDSTGLNGVASNDNFVIVNTTDNKLIDPSKVTVYNIDSNSKEVYVELAGGKFLEGKTYKIAVRNTKEVYSVDSINPLEASATVTSSNPNPKAAITHAADFGGVASSLAAVTNLTIVSDGVSSTGNAALVGATIKVVADGAADSATAVGSNPVTSGGVFAKIALAPSTNYDVYVIDTAGNVSAKVDITTPAAPPVPAPNLAGVSVADDNSNDNKTSITMPALPSGATKFLYKISSDDNAVPTPVVGADWAAYASSELTKEDVTNIEVANGKNIGIAAVNASNEVVQFVNKVAVTEAE